MLEDKKTIQKFNRGCKEAFRDIYLRHKDHLLSLAFGLYTYVNPVPTVTGGPNLVKLLTEDCKDITGGQLNGEKDPVKAVDEILTSIEAKRKKMGI